MALNPGLQVLQLLGSMAQLMQLISLQESTRFMNRRVMTKMIFIC